MWFLFEEQREVICVDDGFLTSDFITQRSVCVKMEIDLKAVGGSDINLMSKRKRDSDDVKVDF